MPTRKPREFQAHISYIEYAKCARCSGRLQRGVVPALDLFHPEAGIYREVVVCLKCAGEYMEATGGKTGLIIPGRA